MDNKKGLPYKIIVGDPVKNMQKIPKNSIDLIITEPQLFLEKGNKSEYGRIDPLKVSYLEMNHVVKDDGIIVSFYDFLNSRKYLKAIKESGLKPVGHIIFPFVNSKLKGSILDHNKMAFVLAKGEPKQGLNMVAQTIPWDMKSVKDFPGQRPVNSFLPLVTSFSKPNGLVLDPYARHGSVGVAARFADRRFIGIEKDEKLAQVASKRLQRVEQQKIEAVKAKLGVFQSRKNELKNLRDPGNQLDKGKDSVKER